MAESETRLETLEDEVKVLKGEVKRTLVDLRALLMREDSPLSDGALARRAAMSDQGTENEINEIPRAGTTRVAAPPLADLTNGEGTGASPSENAGPPFRDGPAEAAANPPSDEPPGGPPQPGPGPAPVPGVVTGASPDNEGGEGPLGHSNHHGELPANEGPPAEEAGPAHRSHARNGHGRPNSRENGPEGEDSGHNGSAGSVYDEYRELLEETRQTHPIEDSPEGPPLDINLLSNLVYWTARAKQRVGEAQLKDILQLYIQSGHSRPELQDLMLQISAMVDADPVYSSENPREREWVELMFHLHGILTGSFPVVKLPNIRPWARDDARGDRG